MCIWLILDLRTSRFCCISLALCMFNDLSGRHFYQVIPGSANPFQFYQSRGITFQSFQILFLDLIVSTLGDQYFQNIGFTTLIFINDPIQ